MTQDEIKEIGKQPVQKDNTILHAKPIKAGFVVWQDDVTEINKLTEQLKEAQKQLGRKNALLQAELKLKEQQAQLEEKNHLYNRITEEVAPQIEKIEVLLEQTKNQDGARQLRRLVQSEVEGPLAAFLLGCSRKPGKVKLCLEQETVSFCS